LLANRFKIILKPVHLIHKVALKVALLLLGRVESLIHLLYPLLVLRAVLEPLLLLTLNVSLLGVVSLLERHAQRLVFRVPHSHHWQIDLRLLAWNHLDCDSRMVASLH
jgi:hypothetical protein